METERRRSKRPSRPNSYPSNKDHFTEDGDDLDEFSDSEDEYIPISNKKRKAPQRNLLQLLGERASELIDSAGCSSKTSTNSRSIQTKLNFAGSCRSYFPLGWEEFKEYFKVLSWKETDHRNLKCQCKICSEKLSVNISSSSNLRRHLKTRHQTVLKTPSQRKREFQTKISSEGKIIAPTSRRINNQRDLHRQISKFIASGYHAYSTVEEQGFKDLICGLRPEFKVPSRKALVKSLQTRSDNLKRQLINTLQNITYVSTTADCWKTFKKNYLGMTVHWLNPENYQRCYAVLACRRIKGSITNTVLAREITKIHDEYLITNKVVSTTTDGGKNFEKAFRVYAEQEDGDSDDENDVEIVEIEMVFADSEWDDDVYSLPPRFPCCAHLMNNLIKDVDHKHIHNINYEKQAEITFGKLDKIWLKQSKGNADTVRDILGSLLKIPCATRWHSFIDAVDDAYKKKKDLNTLCDVLQLVRFTEDDWNFMKTYCQIMKMVSHTLDFLQSEKGTFGAVLPALYSLKNKLATLPSMGLCDPLVARILVRLQERFQFYWTNDTCILATLFHPKYTKWLQSMPRLETKIESLVSTLPCYHRETEPVINEVRNESDSFNIENEVLELSSIVDSITHHDCKQDLANFRKQANGDYNSLDSCVKHHFIKYNSHCSNSATMERVFSRAGDILSRKRSCLSDSNFEAAVINNLNNWLFN